MASLTSKERKALKLYSGGFFRAINDCLRGDSPCSDEILALIRTIDGAIAKSRLSADMVLFRGIRRAAADRLRASSLFVGSSFVEDAFMSTSTSPYEAGMFARFPPGGLMLRIFATAGMCALDMTPHSVYPNECEFLLPRQTELRILGYDRRRSELQCEVIVND